MFVCIGVWLIAVVDACVRRFFRSVRDPCSFRECTNGRYK
jgi:hypothetical protein